MILVFYVLYPKSRFGGSNNPRRLPTVRPHPRVSKEYIRCVWVWIDLCIFRITKGPFSSSYIFDRRFKIYPHISRYKSTRCYRNSRLLSIRYFCRSVVCNTYAHLCNHSDWSSRVRKYQKQCLFRRHHPSADHKSDRLGMPTPTAFPNVTGLET